MRLRRGRGPLIYASASADIRGIAPECRGPQINQLATVAWAALHGIATLAIDGRLNFVLQGKIERALDTAEIELVETLTDPVADLGKAPMLLDLAGSRS